MNTLITEQTHQKSWYQYPMVWLVLGIPLSSVFVGVFLIYLAINNPNDTVNDNYYKDGLGINKLFAEDDRAKTLGLSGQFSVEGQQIKVNLPQVNSPFIRFFLFHNSDRNLDISGAMANDGNGYSFALDQLPDGVWYLELKGDEREASQTWRLRTRVVFPLHSTVLLTPTEQ